MKFHVQAHVTYKTRYHIVWILKYRRKTLVKGVSEYLEKVMDTYLARADEMWSLKIKKNLGSLLPYS